jgi:hypothetical protein
MAPGEAKDFLDRLHRMASGLKGWAVQERGPLPVADAAPGLAPRARALGDDIRRVFDPGGRLAPAWR